MSVEKNTEEFGVRGDVGTREEFEAREDAGTREEFETRNEFFEKWAVDLRKRRLERDEYLQDPPLFSDLWIKRALLTHVLKPIAAKERGDKVDISESRGSNMEVYDFVKEDFVELLKHWFFLDGRNIDRKISGKINKFAGYISKRFVFKLGNTRDFPAKFSDKTTIHPRELMEKAFAPLGYPIINREKRISKNAREVLRTNLYIGNEETHPITAPCVYSEIRRFLEDPDNFSFDTSDEFFVRNDEEQIGSAIESISEDISVGDYKEYIALNKSKRESSDLDKFEDELRPFFNGLVTIGFHDTMRRLIGYGRHTKLDYNQAKDFIEKLCQKYKNETFLLQENTTYGYDPRQSPEKWREIFENNNAAVEFFSNKFISILPPRLKQIFKDENVLREFCHIILQGYFQIPEYEIDPSASVLSQSMLKFLFQAALYLTSMLEADRNSDFDKNTALREFFSKLDRAELTYLHISTLCVLRYFDYASKKGLCPTFRRYEKTQVKIQTKMNFNEGDTLIEGPLSIKDLITKRKDLLKTHRALGEKLLVYFYQIYKLFRETGYILDMKPSNVVRNVFMIGEWALLTENTQISIFKDKHDRIYPKVVNIDPEDHFKVAPKDENERDLREGLATYGFNLTGIVGHRSLLTALARFIDVVAEQNKIVGEKERWSAEKKIIQWISDFIRQNYSDAKDGTGFVARSAVQEARNQIAKAVKLLAEFTESA